MNMEKYQFPGMIIRRFYPKNIELDSEGKELRYIMTLELLARCFDITSVPDGVTLRILITKKQKVFIL